MELHRGQFGDAVGGEMDSAVIEYGLQMFDVEVAVIAVMVAVKGEGIDAVGLVQERGHSTQFEAFEGIQEFTQFVHQDIGR